MAHKSRQPQRAERGKLRPRDRGEKYVAPQILPGDAAAPSAWKISRKRRRSRLARKGEAHELLRKLGPGQLRELAKP